MGRRTPPPAIGGHLPFQGRLCGKCRLTAPSAEGAVRLTKDKPLPWGFLSSQRRGGILHHSLREGFPSFCGRKQRVVANSPQVSISCLFRHDQRALRSPFGNLRPIAPQLYENQRWQVAAALSAAVTTRKPIGDAPNSHRGASPKERASLFPATLRERGSGGEALLLEKRPLPQRLSPPSLRKGARGRELLYREAPSLAYFFVSLFLPNKIFEKL